MPCTTILVGKKATYDGSTIIARNDDSPSTGFTPQCMSVVEPDKQPATYKSVLSHVQVDLSDLTPLRYTCVPNALDNEGVWAASGINEFDVAMTACETIVNNPRVLGADPLVELRPAKGKPGEEGYEPEVPGGIGEEDLITIVLPYIRSAREGVLRLGSLLEEYGTYEMNGVAFSDLDEIWWLETLGGHHWIARRVPDDSYVTIPNQLGIDSFDLSDAEGDQRDYLCSKDLRKWMKTHHLNLTIPDTIARSDVFNPRQAFGTASDADHIYNTPRAWVIQRHLNPTTSVWDGPQADYTPESDNIPWARKPERLLTVEDVKCALSLHYQGTPYDCYDNKGTEASRNSYRPVGVNRTDDLSVLQLRPYAPEGCRGIHWICFGSNVFNALVALYAGVRKMPEYLAKTGENVSTDSFYWANRLVAALCDPHFNTCIMHVERYQDAVATLGHAMMAETDAKAQDADDVTELLEAANEQMASDVRRKTDKLLADVLNTSSLQMKNAFARSDR